MPVSFVGAALAAGDTVAPPAHIAGDLLLAYAVRTADSTTPGTAAGWTSILTASATQGLRVAWRWAADAATPGGVWSNATHVAISAFRGADLLAPIGVANFTNGNNAAPAFPGQDLLRKVGSSWAWCGWSHLNAGNMDQPPAGLTLRASIGSGPMVAVFDTAGGIEEWTARGITANASGHWRAARVEIQAEHQAWAAAGELGAVSAVAGTAAISFLGERQAAAGDLSATAAFTGHAVLGAAPGRLVAARRRILRLPGRPLSWDAKRPEDRDLFALDLTPLLARQDGSVETLVAVLWAVPAGLVLHAQGRAGNVAVADISGGVAGADYALDCLAVTGAGRQITTRVRLPVRAP